MPQFPLIAPSAQATERDHVVREVFGHNINFSSLAAGNQRIVDTEGNAAFIEVCEWAKWYTEVAPLTTDNPTIWNEAFRAVWIAKVKRQARSVQDYHIHWNGYVVPLVQRIADHYAASWGFDLVGAQDEFTPESIRKSVLATVVRQRTPIFPPIREVDRLVREEFVELWNMKQWEFRKRLMRLTITTAGAIEASGGVLFDGLASRSILIQTTNGSYECKWIDSSLAPMAVSRYDGSTGPPRFFYDIDTGTLKKIQFCPMPDQQYTAFATVLIGAPSFGPAGKTQGIENFPVEFRGLLRDTVTARVVSRWGREDNDANRLFAEVERKRRDLTAAWDDKGASRSNARSQNQQRWVNRLTSHSGSNVVGQTGT